MEFVRFLVLQIKALAITLQLIPQQITNPILSLSTHLKMTKMIHLHQTNSQIFIVNNSLRIQLLVQNVLMEDISLETPNANLFLKFVKDLI